MTRKIALAVALLVAGSGAALADHNSKWGEGTAFDPLGIHDARFDSLDTAGEEPFAGGGLAGGGTLVDFISAMRQGRPDTIDIDQGGSFGGQGSSRGDGSGNGGGEGNGGGGNGGNGGGRH